MTGEYSERQVRQAFENHGWVTGGSPGGADVDLVAVHPERGGVIVEVKSVKHPDRFTFSQHARTRRQADELHALYLEGYPVKWVVHYKLGSRGDRYRVYSGGVLGGTGVKRGEGRVLGEWLE